MSKAILQNKQELKLYQAGDELRICRSGDLVSLWEKAGSLMFFKIEALEFGAHAEWVHGRIRNYLANNNFIYIGDIVTQPRDKVARGDPNYRGSRLGQKSMNSLEVELEKIGLCFGLKVPEWRPEDIERLAQALPHRGELSITNYLQGVVRPGGIE